jgi:hypothetical protein
MGLPFFLRSISVTVRPFLATVSSSLETVAVVHMLVSLTDPTLEYIGLGGVSFVLFLACLFVVNVLRQQPDGRRRGNINSEASYRLVGSAVVLGLLCPIYPAVYLLNYVDPTDGSVFLGQSTPNHGEREWDEVAPEFEREREWSPRPPEVRSISNAKKVFSSINTGNAIGGWPSDDIKTAAGKSGWGDWKPENGMQGEVVHSWHAHKRHLLLIDGNYCVVSEDGLEGSPRPKKEENEKDIAKILRTAAILQRPGVSQQRQDESRRMTEYWRKHPSLTFSAVKATFYPLHAAARSGDVEKVSQLLAGGKATNLIGSYANEMDAQRDTALDYAMAAGTVKEKRNERKSLVQYMSKDFERVCNMLRDAGGVLGSDQTGAIPGGGARCRDMPCSRSRYVYACMCLK